MKVFVSSTTKDLGQAREKVCKRLPQIGKAYECMDCYTSDPRSPKQLDDAKVKSCDAFVIIVAHLYGSCPPDNEKSFTELEYEAALESGIDVYAFLASDQFPLSPTLREDDATYKKLQAFRDRLAQHHAPRYFDNEDQLCTEVIAALSKPAPYAGRITVPRIPQPYLAHPYPLQENFTGRRSEGAMLTEWVTAQHGRPMLSLIGMGGLGKSALAWYWLNEDLPQENLKLSGIIWWSFYEQKAGFKAFLNHALLYASGGTINPQALPSDYDRMQALWCILRESPFLVILDGAERLLRAYHALDVAYKGDDFAREKGQQHLLCTDPRAGAFLQWLADSNTKTRTLLTTRLHPRELQDLAGCRKEHLQRLDPDDAVEFMRRQDIKGPRTAIIHACEPYDFLPLCLRLLSGAIREDPQKPNDIAAADGWRPPAKLVRKEHHILEIAYDTMGEDRKALLSRIAAMRGPVDYDTANVLSAYDAEANLKDALRELVARGLLFRQEGTACYDLHPIVRQYAYDRLGDKATAHEALKDYFAAIPKPQRIDSLEDLLPAIELFHHTISSGGYEDACRVYQDRLADALYYQLGVYDTQIALLLALFPDGEDEPLGLKSESVQAWILNSLGVAYNRTGQSRKAGALFQRSLAIQEEQRQKAHIFAVLVNLAGSQRLLGELDQSESNLRRCIRIARGTEDRLRQAFAHEGLAHAHAYMGQYEQSLNETQEALRILGGGRHEQMQGVTWSARALRALLKNDPQLGLKVIDQARQFWKLDAKHDYPVERDLVRILWLSGTAKRQLGDLAGAEMDLNDALSRCRRIGLVEFEADILLQMAKLNWQKAAGKDDGLIDQAKGLTREALEIADRCEYRLKQADIHNFLAQMALAQGDKARARKHAEIAKERAYCDGPPHCYKKALDTAQAMLDQLDTN